MPFATRQLLDAVDADLVLVDPDGIVLWANRPHRRRVGRDPVGRTWEPASTFRWSRARLEEGSCLWTGVLRPSPEWPALESARAAGRAEIAASVLHEVGNALNGVYVAIGATRERLWSARMASVARTARLLAGRGQDLVRFLTEDPRGRKLPTYLEELGVHLEEERHEFSQRLEALEGAVDRVREIVRRQEPLTVPGIEDAQAPRAR